MSTGLAPSLMLDLAKITIEDRQRTARGRSEHLSARGNRALLARVARRS